MHERLFPRLLHHAVPAAILVAVLTMAGTALSRAQDPAPAQTAGDRAPDGERPEEPTQGDGEGAADAQREGPLEDYEASEQISEDLSVAFPVDI